MTGYQRSPGESQDVIEITFVIFNPKVQANSTWYSVVNSTVNCFITALFRHFALITLISANFFGTELKLRCNGRSRVGSITEYNLYNFLLCGSMDVTTAIGTFGFGQLAVPSGRSMHRKRSRSLK